MATNKNQHFVPRCYLRPFTLNSDNVVINLFNIDRLRIVEKAPVKHQCSGSYFYGEDLRLERALQLIEGGYAAALKRILQPGYRLIDQHRDLLRRFWLLQYLRTEAASKRAVQMTEEMREGLGQDAVNFKFEIRDAVQVAMHAFAQSMGALDDLKVCLIRNRTDVPFVTSDDPAVLTNRWYLEDSRTRDDSFGVGAAGAIAVLPLSPKVLCLAYDGDVYHVPHEGGWSEVRHESDVEALNQHQLLNCRANIFFHNSESAGLVAQAFEKIRNLRPIARHRITYAIEDGEFNGHTRYLVVNREAAIQAGRALLHMQTVHARPSVWPRQIIWRSKGGVYTNGTGIGYVREGYFKMNDRHGFRRERSR